MHMGSTFAHSKPETREDLLVSEQAPFVAREAAPLLVVIVGGHHALPSAHRVLEHRTGNRDLVGGEVDFSCGFETCATSDTAV